MIGNVGGGNNLLALLQARTAKTRSATGKPLTAKEAEAAAALQQKQQRADEVLRSLAQMTDSMKRDRKAAAAQKVERLKKELENLRRFSGGGDPKAIARQAARIARELGAAAKEYASAGGGAAVTAPNADVSAPQDAGAQNSATQDTADAAATTAQGEAENGAEPGVNAAVSEAGRVAADAEAKAGDAAHDAEKAKDTAKPLTPEEERAAFTDKLQAKLGELQRKSDEAVADKKFENEVRRLFAEAKAIMEQQRHRAAEQNRDDNDLRQLSKDVEQAGKDIDQAFSGAVEPGLVAASAPVNIVV